MEQNEEKKNIIQFFGKSNPLGLFGKLQCWESILKKQNRNWFTLGKHRPERLLVFMCSLKDE